MSSSNTTSTPDTSPGTTTTTPPPPPPTTTSTTAPPPPGTTSTSTTPPPPPTTPPAPTTPPPEPTTSVPNPPPASSSTVFTETIVTTPPGGGTPSTTQTTITQTQNSPPGQTSGSSGISGTGGPGTTAPANTPGGGNGGPGLQESAKIAVAVTVPIVVVALLVLAGLFFWRKRKQRKDAEQRRNEVEEYGFNPNADGPTVPMSGTGGAGATYEDSPSGYRGWGSTTLAGSTGRKTSTTMSGGAPPVAYSDATSPTHAAVSDTRSAEPLMHGHGDGSVSPEGEILGAMGPSAAGNRGGDMRRGPSNASSSYSAAARSDGSGEGIGMAYGGDAQYYNGYGNGPYSDAYGASPPRAAELGTGASGGASSPVIRDNPARRNTRIENSGHYPQQAGISQNF